ncbi:hypothetical protein BASA84_000805 [Batrachochytrium salamandrivorans]|nr:hypothetical protein BASA84_000805 [Batrachochytrium salamandrivorans]
MKFNALVVAAMVITSVNAAGEGGLLSCFGGICGSGKPQDPICDSIEAELALLWDKVIDLNNEFQEQLPRFYRIMMMKEGNDEKGNKGKRGKKGKKDKKVEEEEKINLKDEQIRTWFNVYPKAIPDLQGFKSKYDSLEKERNEILKRLDESECPETFRQSPLKELAKQGHVPKWYDEYGVNFLGEY